MTPIDHDAIALRVFDALCERRVRDFVDAELVEQLAAAFAVSGRAADLLTGFFVPARERVLSAMAADPPGEQPVTLGEAIPAGVLELIVALLPSLPPPPRALVTQIVGSAQVRAEVRRLLEETFSELLGPSRASRGPRGVIGWGARAATAAGRGVVGAIGGALGADLEGKLGDAVELGVQLAQRRIVDAIVSPENARRVGKELAHLAPRLAEVEEKAIVDLIRRTPLRILDGLVAAALAHNAARPRVRRLIAAEAEATIEALSMTTLGELLDRFGARAPLRAFVGRRGGAVVAAIAHRLA